MDDDLDVRAERNLAVHASHLHLGTPGMAVHDPGDVLVADSGLPDDTYNIVAVARFEPAVADRRIADVVARLEATGPFSWWVGPASRPDDLSARLSAAGLPPEGEPVYRAIGFRVRGRFVEHKAGTSAARVQVMSRFR